MAFTLTHWQPDYLKCPPMGWALFIFFDWARDGPHWCYGAWDFSLGGWWGVSCKSLLRKQIVEFVVCEFALGLIEQLTWAPVPLVGGRQACFNTAIHGPLKLECKQLKDSARLSLLWNQKGGPTQPSSQQCRCTGALSNPTKTLLAATISNILVVVPRHQGLFGYGCAYLMKSPNLGV